VFNKKFSNVKSIIILLIIVIIFFNFDLWSFRRNFEEVKYKDIIEKYASKYSIDAELLAAVIYVESRFDSQAVSHKGAVGLMQIMPATAFWAAEKIGDEEFSEAKLKIPDYNIKIGGWYFAYLLNKYNNDVIKALAAYNAGHTNVSRWISRGWEGEVDIEGIEFKETYYFVKRVISTQDFYKSLNKELFISAAKQKAP